MKKRLPFFTVLFFLCGLFILPSKAQIKDSKLFDMEEILDESTLNVKILKDWHIVEGKVPTRQKLIEIHVGEFYKGEAFRVPVRLIVPKDRKAKGFHLTGGHRLEKIQNDYIIKRSTDQQLIENGHGLVQTVLQKLSSWENKALEKRIDAYFAKTMDPKSTVQYYGWPAQLMRCITAAYADKDYFEEGKVLASGGSKNGASPSVALIHDTRMTALFATVSPYAKSDIRMRNEVIWKKVEKANKEYVSTHEVKKKKHHFLGGYFGPSFVDLLLNHSHSWQDLQTFAQTLGQEVFIADNLDALQKRNVDLLFHPGTHDFVCYDIPLVDKNCENIPVYLQVNAGHGHKPERKEKDIRNADAFILKHFLGTKDELLSRPKVTTELDGNQLHIRFEVAQNEVAENVQLYWMFDRPFSSTIGYLQEKYPEENIKILKESKVKGIWEVTLKIPKGIETVDFFANFGKTIKIEHQKMKTYISSPYTVIHLKEKQKI